MDAFNMMLLIVTLCVLMACIVIPYLIIHKIARTMIRSFKKTWNVIFN